MLDPKNERTRYFDVLDYAGLKKRAQQISHPILHKRMKIHYVDPVGDLNTIRDTDSFSMVTSSHCVEHQLDLVRHFQAISRLLVNGGYYVLMVPDKRYCFDRFISESTIADVLDDYYNDRSRTAMSHKLKSVIEHRALTANNQPIEFWKGEGEEFDPARDPNRMIARLRGSIKEYQDHQKASKYLDVHNYQFTPTSLRNIVHYLNGLELIDLQVHRVYETVHNSLEFYIVLKNNKCM